MLEKIDRKILNRKYKLIDKVDNYQSQIEVQKNNMHQEEYTKETLITLEKKTKNDIYLLKKEICFYETENLKVTKLLEKEKSTENKIKEKVNELFRKEKTEELVKQFYESFRLTY